MSPLPQFEMLGTINENAIINTDQEDYHQESPTKPAKFKRYNKFNYAYLGADIIPDSLFNI